MPYDEELVHRLRELLGEREDLGERRMFGGYAFFVGGHMAVCASGKGGLMARVDPAEAPRLLERPHVAAMVMSGKPAAGWVRVAGEGIRTKRQLEPWVRRSVAYVATLPPKAQGAEA